MAKSIRVAVVGSNGRMGQLACDWIAKAAHMELVARITRDDDLGTSLASSQSEVALDLTVAGLGAAHARTILECGVRAVIGTSGLRQGELQELQVLADQTHLGCLVVPNFCLGITIQQICARLALRFCPASGLDPVQVSILEEHHPQKVDSPSGTSLWTAALLEADGAGRVSIGSERREGVLANQTLTFAWGHESLDLAHRVTNREAFGPGMLLALQHVQTLEGLEVGLESAFGALLTEDSL
jgi:4-hydroxy-tetrahydrodipicolinate reductase